VCRIVLGVVLCFGGDSRTMTSVEERLVMITSVPQYGTVRKMLENFRTVPYSKSCFRFLFPRVWQRYTHLQRLTKSERLVLAAFKERPGLRLQTKDLVDTTTLPRTTIRDALRNLLKAELIQQVGRGKATQYQLAF
jgi:hypothetical protein